MAGSTLYEVYEYLASLIAEREPDEPFLLNQLQPAIRYKFPDFSFADYNLPGVKEFLLSGEKAGYFKLVNTGTMQTSYLAPGPKAAILHAEAEEAIDASDPRNLRWMTLAMEAMLTAERGDQIMDAIRGVNARSPEFDAFLAAEGKAARLYTVRGKIQRLREFLKIYREKGEAQALASWQTSRSLLRMPTIPEVERAATAQSLIWALLQGNTTLDKVPLEAMDNLFFAVLTFSREQMANNKSWDWVAGLNILEADARAIPRPAPPPPAKRGLFGGKQPEPPKYLLDEAEINSLANLLRSMAGTSAAQADPTPTYQAFVDTSSLDAALRFLSERPRLVEDEHLLNWLDDQISHRVAEGALNTINNLAQKAALVITARQYGIQQVPQQTAEFRQTAQSVLEGAQHLRVLFGFVDAPTTADAVRYFQQHDELADSDNVHLLFDDQTQKTVRHGDVARYRRLTERADLWRNLAEFGPAEGVRQHELFLSAGRPDSTVLAEMGIMLLVEATTPDERQEIIGKYPPAATQEGLDIVTRMLDHLSFHNASTEEYNRYYEVKRIIERCLQIGVDRALAELK